MATITELKSGELILKNCNNASYNSGYDYFDRFFMLSLPSSRFILMLLTYMFSKGPHFSTVVV